MGMMYSRNELEKEERGGAEKEKWPVRKEKNQEKEVFL